MGEEVSHENGVEGLSPKERERDLGKAGKTEAHKLRYGCKRRQENGAEVKALWPERRED